MEYIEGLVAAVPKANKQKYIEHAKFAAEIFKDHGAIRLVECWEDDVPDGQLTSFPMAVQRKLDEAIVFSWIVWPSKAVRDSGMASLREDPRMEDTGMEMPFDGQRMIFGGFEKIMEL